MVQKIKNKIKKLLKINQKINQQLEKVLKSNNYEPINNTSETDIFIAGYPKSGNTWVQNLIAGVVFGIDTLYLPDNLTQELVPDIHGKTYYKRFFEPTFFKTHDLPKKHMKRVIHLVRDGRDVMASYYAMNKAMGNTESLEDMIVSGKGIYPSKWNTHTKEWLKNPFEADIIVVRYEDLIQDTHKELQRILNFSKLERPTEVLNKSINGNSFKEMQRKEKDYGWNNKQWKKDEKFIRKGKIGTYKDEIPLNLITFFEKEAGLELNQLGYAINDHE